ncbi:MAG: plasmid maintenance protein CcdB [Sphingomonadales bacterium]|nr:MAG: plasmid maintenance protein CcdB [Sphingomonadales bacterium]
MAQFDVHEIDGGFFVLDCQADSLAHLGTRAVIPLLSANRVPKGTDRLHPVFELEGEPFLLATQLIATLPVRELGRPKASLAGERYAILGALDLLLTGV